MKTHILAVQLVELIRERIKTGNRTPIVGYTKMAELLNWKEGEKFGQAGGMVTSTVDYACLIAGLPMLAYQYVRSADGAMNPDAFRGEYEPFRDEIVQIATTHEWTVDECDRILQTLASLPDQSVKTLWQETVGRGAPFIRYNLHRRIGNAGNQSKP